MLFKQDPKIHGRISIPNQTAANLIQPQGREWRAFRESWMPWIGALAVLGMIAALGLFYFTRGRIRLEHSEESGKKILRFNSFERFSHWMTASCFIVLSLSGLNYIFGKRLLMPLIGPEAFATLAQYGKYAHIYLAWPFMLGVLFMLVLWVRDNIRARSTGSGSSRAAACSATRIRAPGASMPARRWCSGWWSASASPWAPPA